MVDTSFPTVTDLAWRLSRSWKPNFSKESCAWDAEVPQYLDWNADFVLRFENLYGIHKNILQL